MYAFGLSPLIPLYLRTYFTDVYLLVYNSDQDFLPFAELFNYSFSERSKQRISESKKNPEWIFEAKGQHKESLKITCSTQTPT